MKQQILESFLKLFQKDEVQQEVMRICKPLLLYILHEIYPYLYFTMAFVFINFILLLGIFILIVRNKIKLS